MLSIEQKAEKFTKICREKFVTPEGCMPDFVRLSDGVQSGYSDQPFKTGIAVASFAMRYKWFVKENSPASISAKQMVLKYLRGLFLLQAVTGKKGLSARGVTIFNQKLQKEDNWHIGYKKNKDNYADIPKSWLGDVSTDQYVGWVLGMSAAYELIDDESIRSEIRKRVCDVADMFIETGLKIIDIDGKETKHGDLTKKMGFNPLNCLLALAIFSLAREVCRSTPVIEAEYDKLAEYSRYHNKLISLGYHKQAIRARSAWWEYPINLYGKRNDSDDNLAFMLYLSLLWTNPDADYLKESVERTWKYVNKNNAANPFYSFVYHKIMGGE